MILAARVKKETILRDMKIITVLGLWRHVIMTAGVLAVVSVSQAEENFSGLPDPTRPFVTSTPTSAGVYDRAEAYSGPVLQSTIVSSSRRSAVIDGKRYAIGSKFGAGVIADIQPYEVVLRQAGRDTHMRLLPKLAKNARAEKPPLKSEEGENK